MSEIKVFNKSFDILINEEIIIENIKTMASKINVDYKDKDPLFIAVLNGSFMFASDLFKQIKVDCQIEFIKVTSYIGTESSGKMNQLIGLNKSIANKHIIIIEDIIDTGFTVDFIVKQLATEKPASIELCTLLLKPEALKTNIKPKYVCFEVENKFLLGYGLDYDGYGRNLNHVFVEK